MAVTNLDSLTLSDALIVGSNTLTNAAVGVAGAYKIARGTQIATATALVTTGLSTVVAFAVSPIAASTTTIRAAAWASGKAAATAGKLNVYRWKHTGATTVTPVAASAAGTVSWIAVGT